MRDSRGVKQVQAGAGASEDVAAVVVEVLGSVEEVDRIFPIASQHGNSMLQGYDNGAH